MHTRPDAPRPRHLMRDESGVIAIIVALSISTFLLGFAALAVDLGTAYVRKAELTSIADKLALAGANGLPTIDDALASVKGVLGRAPKTDSATDPGAGICADEDLPGVCDSTDWEHDGKTSNGEITFYGDEGQAGSLADTNHDGVLSTADQLLSGDQAVGIDVLLPPSQVQFGLASALGFNSAHVQEHASARIGTPLGAGILPFALKPQDLTTGQFCVQDPLVPPVPNNPAPFPSGPIILLAPDTLFDPDTPGTTDVTLFPNFGVNRITVFFENGPTGGEQVTRNRNGNYTVKVPLGDPGTSVRVWATGNSRFLGRFTSGSDSITYSGTAPTGTDPCAQFQANRGFVKLARSSGGDSLEPNVRTGPQAKLYPTAGPLGTIGTTLGCLGDTLATPPSTTCLSTVIGQTFSTRMTNGFFNSSGGDPGRLDGDCGAGTISPRGYGGVDAMKLLDTASPLVDTNFGSVDRLKTAIQAGPIPDGKQGWIRSRIFKCPRLAVMPIVDPAGLTLPSAIVANNITGFTYVWIDDNGSGRGLLWAGTKLRAFRGYVVDPKLLPTLVSGSPIVGPYLGDSMPKESMLIPDLPTP